MRTRIGYQFCFGINGIAQGRDIRKAAKDLRMGPDEVIIQGPEQLIAVMAVRMPFTLGSEKASWISAVRELMDDELNSSHSSLFFP